MSSTPDTQTSPVNDTEQLSCSLCPRQPSSHRSETTGTVSVQTTPLPLTTCRRRLQLQSHVNKHHVHTIRLCQAHQLQSLNIHTYLNDYSSTGWLRKAVNMLKDSCRARIHSRGRGFSVLDYQGSGHTLLLFYIDTNMADGVHKCTMQGIVSVQPGRAV